MGGRVCALGTSASALRRGPGDEEAWGTGTTQDPVPSSFDAEGKGGGLSSHLGPGQAGGGGIGGGQ